MYKLKYDNNGDLESYRRNEDEIQKAIGKLGFFMIVTSKEMSASMEAIDALQGHKTLIIVAHRLTTIRNCDKVYEIKDGKAHLEEHFSI